MMNDVILDQTICFDGVAWEECDEDIVRGTSDSYETGGREENAALASVGIAINMYEYNEVLRSKKVSG